VRYLFCSLATDFDAMGSLALLQLEKKADQATFSIAPRAGGMVGLLDCSCTTQILALGDIETFDRGECALLKALRQIFSGCSRSCSYTLEGYT